MTLSFEDYLAKIDNNSLQESRKNVEKLGLEKSLKVLVILAEKEDDPKDAYNSLYRGVSELYQCLKINDELSNWLSVVEPLAKAFWELDELCGSGLKPMEPGLSQEEENIRLSKLDLDREKFKQFLKKRLNEVNTQPEAGQVLAFFAELIFMFNGYQAPMRLNPEQAMRDAMGLSDLFEELLNEIANELEIDEE